MPTYYDSKGKAHILAEEIGRGGEGTVYFCDGKPDLVAKIYYEQITEEKAEKLRWMAANKNEHLLKVSAWVVDVLYEDESLERVVGFLMPNVKAKEIHELYSLKSRRVYFPEATWHFLVHTSANVARAFYNLHRDDHVMGDVNHGNCVVLADGTVKLIDCDSYSIKADDLRYICEVGVATHLAPELQGKNLRDVEREKEHDNFGLAVIIFQLLFLGRHPFSGNVPGEKDKTLEECIREYRFAYGKNAKVKKIQRPPGTLSLSGISPRIAGFFERAFSENEKRPDPREWVEALEDLSNNLEQCSLHPGHHFYEKLKACPWCRIESQTGLMLFPFITTASNQNGEKPFNIFTIESLISNLGISQNLPAKLMKPAAIVPAPPSRELISSQNEFYIHKIMVVIAHFVAIAFLTALFGVGSSCFFGLILMIFFIVHLNNYDKSISEDIRGRLADAQQEWENLKEEWSQGVMSPKLNDDIGLIRAKIGEYQNTQQLSVRELKRLREDNSHRRFDKYLRSQRLANTKILGIKEEQKEELIKKGVRTAAEVEKKRLTYFHNIDDYLTKRLLTWREEVEQNYKPEKDAEIPEQAKKEFLQKTAEKRRTIEKEIETLLGSLRSGSVYLKKKQQQLLTKSEEIGKELIQAESDMQVLGNNSSAVLALILISFFTPLLGIMFNGGVDTPKTERKIAAYEDSYSGSGGGRGSGRGSGTGSSGSSEGGIVAKPMPSDEVKYDLPDEDITEEEIANLPNSERNGYAETLYNLSATLSSNADRVDADKSGYREAEKKIRFAIRFNEYNVSFLNQLGYVLYQQKKYDESLKYLNEALEFDRDNYGTKVTIGITYLKMEKYKDARRIFSEIIANESTLEGHFNLGLAYEGLKDYTAAAKSFSRAIEIDPSDADSHYELGYVLYKKGDKDGAYGQYHILKKMDIGLADKLQKTANLFYPEKYSGGK